MAEIDEVEKSVLLLLTEALPKKFAKKSIRPEMSLQRDLGLDSIVVASLIFRLEGIFGIDISAIELPANATRVRTVADAFNVSRAIVDAARTIQPL